MANRKPITIGTRFGRLTVCGPHTIKVYGPKSTARVYPCVCDCGKTVTVAAGTLFSSNTRSCGCLRNEETGKRKLKHGAYLDPKKFREYRRWKQMIARCRNPKNTMFPSYGGRGITVCDRWFKLRQFL